MKTYNIPIANTQYLTNFSAGIIHTAHSKHGRAFKTKYREMVRIEKSFPGTSISKKPILLSSTILIGGDHSHFFLLKNNRVPIAVITLIPMTNRYP